MRLTAMFMGLALFLLAMALLVAVGVGPDEFSLVDLLLGAGVFLILFTGLLLVPRLWGRGAMSYSLVVPHSLDTAEDAVRGALQDTGRSPAVEVQTSRFGGTARMIRTDGLGTRFVVKIAAYRATSREDPWTEIVQTGLPRADDATARDLRERIASRLERPAAAGE